MLQRLKTALAQEKSGKTLENLLKKIYQIINYLYLSKKKKKKHKKVYNNVMSSIKI